MFVPRETAIGWNTKLYRMELDLPCGWTDHQSHGQACVGVRHKKMQILESLRGFFMCALKVRLHLMLGSLLV